MIVRCERCETRFKLDESRLPARGARVRCSRCKHAFFVTPPGAAAEEVVHEVAAAAARAPGESLRGPEPSWDLEENPEATVTHRKAPTAAVRPAGPAEDDASDWHFEDEVSGLDPDATRSSSFDLGGRQEPPPFATAPDPNEDSFAELGDPETWDLLAGAPPQADAATSPSTLPGATRVDVVPGADAGEHSDPASSVPDAASAADPQPVPAAPVRVPPSARGHTAAASPAVVTPRRIPPAPRGLSMRDLGGWSAVVGLAAGIAWASLAPAVAPVNPSAPLPISGFEVREAQGRVIENLAAGPILVVSGRLRNPTPSARPLGAPLAVQLLDADGAPLATAAGLAGPALPDQRVREETPERLVASRQEAAVLASAPVVSGGDLAFTAVFAPAPHGAARFVLTADAGRP